MKLLFKCGFYSLIIALLFNISCSKNTTGGDTDIENSLEPVEEVKLISGGENATMTVNLNAKDAYFDVQFSNIEPNNIIQNGSKKAWCIDIRQSIDHEEGTYENIPLYSTYGVETWKPLNYMFNKKEEWIENNPELSWLDFQVVIWALRTNPKFDLDEADIEELPGQFHNNGEPKFSPQNVRNLLNTIEERYRNFDYANSDRFVVIAETPSDVQTIITIVERE